jgi:hypothetical protein
VCAFSIQCLNLSRSKFGTTAYVLKYFGPTMPRAALGRELHAIRSGLASGRRVAPDEVVGLLLPGLLLLLSGGRRKCSNFPCKYWLHQPSGAAGHAHVSGRSSRTAKDISRACDTFAVAGQSRAQASEAYVWPGCFCAAAARYTWRFILSVCMLICEVRVVLGDPFSSNLHTEGN